MRGERIATLGPDPLDPAFDLPWPDDLPLILSDRDRDAPSLADTAAAGLLPRYDECLRWYASLREPDGPTPTD